MNLKPLFQFIFLFLSSLCVASVSLAVFKELSSLKKILILIPQSEPGNLITLKGERATIGRSPENTIQLLDPGVSTRHCQIFVKRGEYVLADLGSRNGTFVNGQRVSKIRLADGDRIQIGKHVFEVRTA